MNDSGFMYRNMTERDFIFWNLEYTMNGVIETFKSIPDEWLCLRPHPNVLAPGWTFGHIAVTERVHVGMFLQGIDDIPTQYKLFYGRRAFDIPEEELSAAIQSKEALISYWREVREKTREYLHTITDTDLAKVPEKSLHPPEVNRNNPIREWFVMTIQHQNKNFGALCIVKRLIDGKR